MFRSVMYTHTRVTCHKGTMEMVKYMCYHL